MSHTIGRRVGGVAAGAFTHLAAYARAVGLDPREADRHFGRHIDRFARLMDSAVRLSLIGPVGIDPLISMVPVVGDLAAGAVSLTLVARSLRYGPPAALVSKMLANVLTDLILGAIPVVGVLADIWFRANDRNAALLREYLQKQGYRVTAVADGKALRATVETSRPDVIVLDLMMPGEDGLSLCRGLRAHSDVPIIMLTARGERE